MAYARRTDPATSHEAADSVRNLTQTQMAVLNILSTSPVSLSDDAIIDSYMAKAIVGIWPMASISGIRTRRSELAALGLVVVKDYGKSFSGRRCALWGLAND